MEKTDVLVVGGSAAGIVAATTGKSFHPDKDFMLIRKEKQAVVPRPAPDETPDCADRPALSRKNRLCIAEKN